MKNKIRIFLLAMVLGAWFVSTALALPKNYVFTSFYTNSTYSVECGYRIVHCNGVIEQFGTVTVYRQTFTEPCVSCPDQIPCY